MYINWQLREINLKVVYYGPALSGKTTNLEQIHRRVPAQRRSDLVSLKTSEDRTLYFDFLQLDLGKISGMTPKIHLYTVPGQAYYEASRKLVLRGADGVVFVADSASDRLAANIRAWENMKSHLQDFNIPLHEIALAIQFNKQDLSNALHPEVLKRHFHLNGSPIYNAVAVNGVGVFETLKAITQGVVTLIHQHAG